MLEEICATLKYSKAPERQNVLSDKNTLSTFKFNPVMTCRVSASFVWQSQNYNDFCSNTQKCNRRAKGSQDLNHGLTQQQGFKLCIIYRCLGHREERNSKNLYLDSKILCSKLAMLTKRPKKFFFLNPCSGKGKDNDLKSPNLLPV